MTKTTDKFAKLKYITKNEIKYSFIYFQQFVSFFHHKIFTKRAHYLNIKINRTEKNKEQKNLFNLYARINLLINKNAIVWHQKFIQKPQNNKFQLKDEKIKK